MPEKRKVVLERVEIVAFGKLKNFVLEPSEGVNLLCAPNESGKSTLAAFLRFAFYGFADSRKRELAENDRKLYTPWDAPRAEGSVTVRKGEERYRVTRLSAGTKETVEVVSALTGKRAFEGEVPGEAIFGVSEEVFGRTLFFRQSSSGAGKDKDGALEERLQNLAVSEEERVCSGEAVERLTKERNALKGRAGNGWIPRLEQETARLERALDDAKREHAAWESLTAERQSLGEKIERNRDAGERVEREKQNLERWEASQKRGQLERIRAEAETAREAYERSRDGAVSDRAALTGLLAQVASLETARQRENAASDARASAEREVPPPSEPVRVSEPGRRSGFPALLAVGGVLFAAGVVLFAFRGSGVLPFAVVLAVAGVASAVVGWLLRGKERKRLAALRAETEAETLRLQARTAASDARLRELRAAETREREAVDALERALSDGFAASGLETPDLSNAETLRADLRERLAACDERDRRKAAWESAENAYRIASEGVDLDALASLAEGAVPPARPREEVEREAAFLRQQQNLLTEKDGQLRDRISAIEGRGNDPALLAGKLQAASDKLAECRRRYEAYEAARLGILEASDRLKSMAAPRLGEIAGRYFSESTGGKYEGLQTDTRLSMRFRDGGIERESEYLSAGTRDSAALSLRLALAELLFDGEGMPLVLDDAFGRLDDGRLENAMRVLGKAAERHQFLVLCCSDREEKALARAGVPCRKWDISDGNRQKTEA